MTEINIILELIKAAPVIGIMGWWKYEDNKKSNLQIANLNDDKKEFQRQINNLNNDFIKLFENAVKVITLADDKIAQHNDITSIVKDMHRILKKLEDKVV